MGVKIKFPQLTPFKDVKDVYKYLTAFNNQLSIWENFLSAHKHLGTLNDFDTVAVGGAYVGWQQGAGTVFNSAYFKNTVTGLTLSNSSGVATLALTSGYVIPTTTEESNWNTAYGWGNHAGLYLKLDQTTPQAFSAGTVAGSGLLKVTSGTLGLDTATYLTAEVDPVYSANTYAVGMDQSVAKAAGPVFDGVTIKRGTDVAGSLNWISAGYMDITASTMLILNTPIVDCKAGNFNLNKTTFYNPSATHYSSFTFGGSADLVYGLPLTLPATVDQWMKSNSSGQLSFASIAQADVTGLTTASSPLFTNVIAGKYYMGTSVSDPYIWVTGGKISGSVNFAGTFEGGLHTYTADVDLSKSPDNAIGGKLWFSGSSYMQENWSGATDTGYINVNSKGFYFNKADTYLQQTFNGFLKIWGFNSNQRVDLLADGSVEIGALSGKYTHIDQLAFGATAGFMKTSVTTGAVTIDTNTYYTSGDSPSFLDLVVDVAYATMHVNSATHQVGIGTATPLNAKLNIKGPTPLQFNNATTDGFKIFQSNINEWYIQGLSFSTLYFDNTNVLVNGTITSTGLTVNGNKINVSTAKTPSSKTDTGTTGDICWDSSYVYICYGTNQWKRVAITDAGW